MSGCVFRVRVREQCRDLTNIECYFILIFRLIKHNINVYIQATYEFLYSVSVDFFAPEYIESGLSSQIQVLVSHKHSWIDTL